MDSQIKNDAWLAWLEQLALAPANDDRQNEISRSLFHCLLDDQPDHLVPLRLLRPGHWEAPSDRPFFINPLCLFTAPGALPAAASHTAFAPEGRMVWLQDPASDALQPYWIGPELSQILSDLRPGDPAPRNLSPQTRRTLILANLLVTDDYASYRRQQWTEIVSAAGAQFRKHGYAAVGRLIHPFHISALRRYYRHQLRTGKLRLGDSQSPQRYIAYNDPVARFFHQQLTSTIAAFAGEPVKPSYVYLAAYQPGAILARHVDREQCEFSITLCLDYSPEPGAATPWPIHLQKNDGIVTVFQAIGDALLYRGCQLPHWRNPLPHGHTSASIFFHYVREDFAGSLE
jgi:hypothetical protein